jgi:hypothetical protein
MNMMHNMMQNQNSCSNLGNFHGSCGSQCDNPFEAALAMNPMFQAFKMSPMACMLKMTPIYKFWHAFHHQMWLADVMRNSMNPMMNNGSHCHMNPLCNMGSHIPDACGPCCPLTGKPLCPFTGCPINSCSSMNHCSEDGIGHLIKKMFMNPYFCNTNCNPMMHNSFCHYTNNSCNSNNMNCCHPHDLYKMMIQYYGSCAEKLAHCSSEMLNKCKDNSSCDSSSWCNVKSCCPSEHLKCLEKFSNDWTEHFSKFQEKMVWWNEKVSANMKLVAENIKLLKEQMDEHKKNCATEDKKSSDTKSTTK